MATPTSASPINKVINGARAKLIISDRVVGIFNGLSISFSYDAQPVYVLGRFEPVEINYTSQAPVTVRASGWRVIDHGPHVSAKLPKLQDLINQSYISLDVVDRQTGKVFGKIRDVKCTGFSTNIGARQQEEISVEFVGIYYWDENSGAGAAEDAIREPAFPA